MSLFNGTMVWALVAVAALVVGLWLWRTVSAVRLIARRPPASIGALNLHDGAVGSIARALAVVVYFLAGMLTAAWWPGSTRSASWAFGIAGVVTLGALIVMELRWPVPGGTVRTAELRRRSARDVLPRAGTAIAGLGLAIGLGAIVVCGWTSHSSAAGGTTTIARETPDGMVHSTVTTPPWPGWAETAPLLIGLAAVVAASTAAVAVLLRRPALSNLDADIDMAYRRAGADRALRVVAAAGFLTAATVGNWVQQVAIAEMAGAPQAGPVSQVFGWQSFALFVAALVSINIFRARCPKEPARRAPAAPIAPAAGNPG